MNSDAEAVVLRQDPGGRENPELRHAFYGSGGMLLDNADASGLAGAPLGKQPAILGVGGPRKGNPVAVLSAGGTERTTHFIWRKEISRDQTHDCQVQD